jgi:hypothetical protein
MALLNCDRKHCVELPDHGLIFSAVLGESSMKPQTYGRPEVVKVWGLGAADQLESQQKVEQNLHPHEPLPPSFTSSLPPKAYKLQSASNWTHGTAPALAIKGIAARIVFLLGSVNILAILLLYSIVSRGWVWELLTGKKDEKCDGRTRIALSCCAANRQGKEGDALRGYLPGLSGPGSC